MKDSPADLMEALRQYRIWVGEPPFRKMVRHCRLKRS
jgi:hypothetical protein